MPSRVLFIRKMKASSLPDLEYHLDDIPMNPLVGKTISLEFTGKIECIYCGRSIKKTFSQGYCFPCAQKLARCDLCIVRPEKCHYHLGTCREPEWGEENCLIEHSIYLANTAGLKVGITRTHQKETRWADQGATEALEIGRVPNRLSAGNLEVALKKHFNDRSDWRKLVTGKEVEIDLLGELEEIKQELGEFLLADQKIQKISYPVLAYPEKAKSFNEKKESKLEGKLIGIRGQYLLFADRVINLRKFQGYEAKLNLQI